MCHGFPIIIKITARPDGPLSFPSRTFTRFPFWDFFLAAGESKRWTLKPYFSGSSKSRQGLTIEPLSTAQILHPGTGSIMSTLVLPGDKIPSDLLPIPLNPSVALKLGPGLRHVPPSTITPVLAGPLCVDNKKNAIWVERNNGRVR